MPNRDNLLSLAERIERASADEQYDLLGDAWDELGPSVNWTCLQAQSFARKLDAGAHESAAMMLAGEKWSITADGDGSTWQAAIWPEIDDGSGFDWRNAATPALALCAAALRAHAVEGRDG